jgi:uncharacterized membrane protein
MSQLHYLPLHPVFFAILVGLFILLVVLIQIGILRYAYMRLGVSSRVALLLLFASLIGSYFNIPLPTCRSSTFCRAKKSAISECFIWCRS